MFLFQFRYRPCSIDGRVIAQAVSHRLVTAEARVRFRLGPCRFYVRQSGTQVFLGIFWITAGYISPQVRRIHSSVTDSVQLTITRVQRKTDRDNSLLVLQFFSTGVVLVGY